MKKILSRIILAAALLLIMTRPTMAAGNVVVSQTSITLDPGGSTSFTISGDNAAGIVAVSSTNTSVATVSVAGSYFDSKEGTTMTVTVTAVNPGSTYVEIDFTDVVTYDEEQLPGSRSIPVTVKAPKSSNANLSSLTASGITLNRNDDTHYSGSVGGSVSSITISATAEDSKASVSGTGSKSLNYGSNTFSVIVTAENGAKKTYYVTITRPDNRSTNNALKTFAVNGVNTSCNADKTSCSATVGGNVTSATITATAEDSKAKVSGAGTKSLSYGKNTFSVTVTAENGAKKVYYMYITRPDNRSTNNNLSKIEVKNQTLTKKDDMTYTLKVGNSIDVITVTATAEDSKAKVSGTGTKNLKVGDNDIAITVEAENGSKKVYHLIVTRRNDVYYLKDAADFVQSDATTLLLLDGDKVTSAIIDELKKINRDIEMVKRDQDGNTLYKIALNTQDLSKEFSTDISTVEKSYSFDGETLKGISIVIDANMPQKAKISLRTDKYKNGAKLDLYKVVKGKLSLIKTIKMADNAISFESTDGELFVTKVAEEETASGDTDEESGEDDSTVVTEPGAQKESNGNIIWIAVSIVAIAFVLAGCLMLGKAKGKKKTAAGYNDNIAAAVAEAKVEAKSEVNAGTEVKSVDEIKNEGSTEAKEEVKEDTKEEPKSLDGIKKAES